MNQINPGDIIVTINDAPTMWTPGHVIPKGTRGLVERSGPPILGPYNVYAKFEGDPIGRQVRPGDVAVVPTDHQPAPEPEREESEFKRGFRAGYQNGYTNGRHEATTAPDEASETSEDAPAPEPEPDVLAGLIWNTSRLDEGTISATGANKVAAAIRESLVVIDPAAARSAITDALGEMSGLTTWTQGGGLTTRSCRLVLDRVMSALGIEAP